MIVAIEGIDGCGKTTQTFLAAKDFNALQLKFPDYKTMPQIREFLEGRIHLNPKSLFLMYLADICQGIYNSDYENNLIFLDRYIYSTVAYAGTMDREVAMNIVEDVALPVPDLVVWVDIGVDIALKRKANHKELDRYEKDAEFMTEVKSVYETMFKKNFFAKQWVRVDGNKNIQQVYNEIKPILEKTIKGTQ